ncbi:hypothetical protein J4O73_19110 [Methylobacterium sp. NFXW15]
MTAVLAEVGDALLGVPLQSVGLLAGRVANFLNDEGLGVRREVITSPDPERRVKLIPRRTRDDEVNLPGPSFRAIEIAVQTDLESTDRLWALAGSLRQPHEAALYVLLHRRDGDRPRPGLVGYLPPGMNKGRGKEGPGLGAQQRVGLWGEGDTLAVLPVVAAISAAAQAALLRSAPLEAPE